MALHHKQKAALITGAAQRVGREITLKLAALGYDIALHYNTSETQAQTLKRQIHSLKRRCELFPCDLKDPDRTQDLVGQVHREFPYLSLLINSASIFEPVRFQDSNWENLDNNYAIHLRAPYVLTKEFAKRCKDGQIINMLETHIVNNRLTHFDYLLTTKASASFPKLDRK